MLNQIIQFSIKNKLLIGLMTLALIGWGVYNITQLPIDAVPDITNNQVQVITVSPSLGAQEVERLISFPVELSVASVPGIIEIRSFSRFGLSLVTIVFEEERDVYWARQQVAEKLKEAAEQIPPGIGTPTLAPVTTGLGEIYQYELHPAPGYQAKYNSTELRTIQDWIVRRQLLGTRGVAEVNSFGGHLKQYEVAISSEKLRAMNTTITEVFDALENNNANAGGAYIEKSPNAYFIRTQGLVQQAEDIGRIVVKDASAGVPVLIRDLAEVREGSAIRYGAMVKDDEGEVAGGIVMMLKGENSSQVIKRVKDKIEEIRKTLPEGVVIEPFLDRTKLVNRAIHTVEKNLTEGALIVVFVLVLLLGNLRAGLLVASVIPLAMLFAISLMNLFGVSGNLMSLGALDFGLIVDGAVIIVESVIHRISMSQHHHVGIAKLSQEQMDEEVYDSASKMMSFASFGQIIILIVYLPILALVGIEGKMFKPMAQTVAFAILGAFLLSLTYVPMMAALFLSRKTGHKVTLSDRIMQGINRGYQPLLNIALRLKGAVLFTALGLFAVALFLFTRMGGEFIPQLDEGDFAIETRVLTGSSLQETIDVVKQASGILKTRFPEVEKVVTKIGSAEVPTEPNPVELGDMIVVLKDHSEWSSASTREELASKISDTLTEYVPQASFGVQQPIQMRFNELMTGARQDVVIKIYGEDLDSLAEFAERLGQLVQSVPGAQDLYIEQMTGLPQIVVNYNRENLARYGLSIREVNRTVTAAFAGETAGQVYEGEKRFDLVVRMAQQYRHDIADVQNLFVSNAAGFQIPLDQLARVQMQNGPNQIQRDATRRRITVGFNVRGRDVQSIVDEIQGKVSTRLKLPPGYAMTYGGQFQNLLEAKSRLSVAVPLALLMIFILLFFAFRSVKQSVLIFSAIPLSAIGGIFALLLRGMPFSISAGVGFIALFGVAVLNGIVLIGYFNQLKQGGLTDVYEIIRKGTTARLRPIIMTATVASLGFLPMALSSSAGAEVQKPLATVVIGGLVSATLLTLVVLPVIYYFSEKGIRQLKAIALLCLLAFPVASYAQGVSNQPRRTYSLQQAVDTALQQNAGIRAGQYQIQLQQTLRKTASDVGKTSFSLTHGQYNSVYTDNQFTLSQSIPFPTTLVRQAELARAQVRSSELHLLGSQNDLVYQVKTTYYQLAFLQARQRLIAKQDSLYAGFVRASTLRYRTGESNVLEKATAESALADIRTALAQNEADIRIYQSHLQTLLNSSASVDIADTSLALLPLSAVVIDVLPLHNPTVAFTQQQIEVEKRQKALERSRLLPDLTIGYFNQSMAGFQNTSGVAGAPEQFFDASKRFTGWTAGIALPLWFKPQAARVQAAALNTKVAESNAQLAEKQLQGDYTQAMEQYNKYLQSLTLYRQSALPQADLLLQHAEKAFQSGDIDYVEFLQGLSRALSIRTTYLDLVNGYNQAVLQLEFLAGNQ